jgi:8-oxo-dGTP pyrophosphatase MutT (NUDIX family)
MDFHRIREVIQTQHTLGPNEWEGAVLFLCNEEHVFLIKRAESMPTHSGQVAFVGGHKREDEHNPWEVAQREYEEETHHHRDSIEFVGYLPAVLTARQRPIIPVVARLLISTEQFMQDVRSNGEWDHIMAHPWAELLHEGNWSYGWRHGLGKFPVLFHTVHHNGPHLLWGATASMIWSLLRLYFKP